MFLFRHSLIKLSKILLTEVIFIYNYKNYILQFHLYQSPVVTICTASLIFKNSTFSPHSVFMCFVWI